MSETSKTAKIILVLYWGLGYNRSHIRSMTQYCTKMIFAVLDVSLITGLNIGETDKVFYINVIQAAWCLFYELQGVNPQQFIECYIAEQNLVGVAIGCATRNRAVTFASTFACFLSRAYDQLRMGAISQTNANFCGSHCGVSIGMPDSSSYYLCLCTLHILQYFAFCFWLLPAGSAASSSAGISFTHGPILGFFAPQGRHVAPIKVKFGREERTVLPNLTLIGSEVGVYGPQN